MKNYICGRSNLALTIQVPYDCPNTCPFCTAKAKYQKEKPPTPLKFLARCMMCFMKIIFLLQM